MSRPDKWPQMILEKVGSKSERGREWDTGQIAVTACGCEAINPSRRLRQNAKLQKQSVSAFCGAPYPP